MGGAAQVAATDQPRAPAARQPSIVLAIADDWSFPQAGIYGDPAVRKALARWMRETADPRATTDDDRWDRFPYYGQPEK